ncbi:uncharacterized protein EV420DRAFT_1522358 [Desarmillaria tabescens]|uniref:F-box domain-containing protein n=1 Tax=Armillaria tabescens TaxID=1929756 RepID=A0AA39NCL7_ARMTA|nr:uncharacterized protein EV420DRAFT_1522358 [Desarmillaria tabescens]KAK0463028.1 hypothetical protein EV420DRAFT_1522358 [Desarmillaria tabescens]
MAEAHHKRAGPQALSQELIDSITDEVSHLDDDDRVPTLCSLCLTSRQVSIRAKAHLFRVISITLDSETIPARRISELRRLFKSNPGLAPLVKCFITDDACTPDTSISKSRSFSFIMEDMKNLTLIQLEAIELYSLPRRDAFFAAFSACTKLTDVRLEGITLHFQGLQTILTSVPLDCLRLSDVCVLELQGPKFRRDEASDEPFLVDFQDPKRKVLQPQKDLNLSIKQLVLELVTIEDNILMDMLTTSRFRILAPGVLKRLAIITASCNDFIWKRIQIFLEIPEVRDSVSELHLGEDYGYSDGKGSRMTEEHLNIRLPYCESLDLSLCVEDWALNQRLSVWFAKALRCISPQYTPIKKLSLVFTFRFIGVTLDNISDDQSELWASLDDALCTHELTTLAEIHFRLQIKSNFNSDTEEKGDYERASDEDSQTQEDRRQIEQAKQDEVERRERRKAERKAWLDEFKDKAEEWVFRVCLPKANAMYGFHGSGSAKNNIATSVDFSTNIIPVFDMDAILRN